MSKEIQILFDEIAKYNTYPDSMLRICGEIKGVAFFPGGKGTIDCSDDLSDKKIMILGQDFDCEKNYKTSLDKGTEDIKKNPTWRNILKLLEESGIKGNQCFFTNAIMGIRKGNIGTGKSPAFRNKGFIEYCQRFFIKQIDVQKPRLIIVLGLATAEFLSSINEKLAPWGGIKNFQEVDENDLQVIQNVHFIDGLSTNLVLIVHPSFRNSNVHRRRFGKDFEGNEAEIEMIKTGLSNVSI